MNLRFDHIWPTLHLSTFPLLDPTQIYKTLPSTLALINVEIAVPNGGLGNILGDSLSLRKKRFVFILLHT